MFQQWTNMGSLSIHKTNTREGAYVDNKPDDTFTAIANNEEITIITITIDDNQVAPKIDLGGCHVARAELVFRQAIEALKILVPLPTIEDNGELLLDVNFDDDFDIVDGQDLPE